MTTFTTNFRLTKPDFNAIGWDTQLNADLDAIDSILGQFNTGFTIQGVWLNSTLYSAGITVIDSLTGHIWLLSTTYTSGASPGTFAQDRAANPTFWTDITNPAIGAAASAANALISANNAAASFASITALVGAGPSTGTGVLVLATGPTITNLTTAGATVLGGTLSGTGISSYLASPPAIGGTVPAPIAATTISATGLISPTSTVGIKGTATNDTVQAGSVGEFVEAIMPGTSATVTVTIAAPAVVTYTAHGMAVNGGLPGTVAFQFTTTGALPTGLAAATTYFATIIDANTFKLSTSVANAIAGTFITTTGTQSGTHTGLQLSNLASTVTNDVAALSLTAGEWEVWGSVSGVNAGTNTVMSAWTNTASKAVPAAPFFGRVVQWLGSFVGALPTLPVGRSRYLLSATTTVYLSAVCTSNAGGGFNGYLAARRVR